MTTEQLTKYLPRYGDCLAVIAFVKQQLVLNNAPNVSHTRKQSLRDRLIAKLQGKRKTDEHLRRSVPQEGNTNAKKISRKIEIGWLHWYGVYGALKQVRSPSGGGTRNVHIEVNTKISELLQVAKGLFFPAGNSKKGSEEQFEFYVSDQTQKS